MRATFTECARCSFRTFTCIISESFSVLSSHVCMHAQSCLTLCNPMICSPPGSSVYGIFPVRIPEWVAISYSRGSSRPKDGTHISCVSCLGRQILYHWMCEAPCSIITPQFIEEGAELQKVSNLPKAVWLLSRRLWFKPKQPDSKACRATTTVCMTSLKSIIWLTQKGKWRGDPVLAPGAHDFLSRALNHLFKKNKQTKKTSLELYQESG